MRLTTSHGLFVGNHDYSLFTVICHRLSTKTVYMVGRHIIFCSCERVITSVHLESTLCLQSSPDLVKLLNATVRGLMLMKTHQSPVFVGTSEMHTSARKYVLVWDA